MIQSTMQWQTRRTRRGSFRSSEAWWRAAPRRDHAHQLADETVPELRHSLRLVEPDKMYMQDKPGTDMQNGPDPRQRPLQMVGSMGKGAQHLQDEMKQSSPGAGSRINRAVVQQLQYPGPRSHRGFG